MSAAPLVLIDLSSIAHPLFHLSGSEPDPNWVSTQVLAKVRALASGQPHVAICCDGPKSRATRQALDPTYKAQREAAPEALYHQIRLAVEALRGDGFPIWSAEGHEADDVIASAVLASGDAARFGMPADVLIVTADKDLCQLVGPRVTIKHALKGDILDADGVKAKFGVRPDQIGDYLALVGDASDNIRGAKGIGAKRAAELLCQHDTLTAIFATGGEGMTPAVRESLVEFSSRADTVRALIALRSAVPVKIEEAFVERVATAATAWKTEAPSFSMADHIADDIRKQLRERAVQTSKAEGPVILPGAPESRVDRAADTSVASPAQDVVDGPSAPSVTLMPLTREWTHELEPRNMAEARQLADDLFASRLFGAYGSPPAVLSTILAGRELGLQAMASLRGMHIIESKPTLSSNVIQAMVLKSKLCTYFRCTERTNERATFIGKRGDDPEMAVTFTIDDARRAWSGDPAKFDKSGWGRNPADLCVARAATKLARLLWPDVVAGFYASEEFEQ